MKNNPLANIGVRLMIAISLTIIGLVTGLAYQLPGIGNTLLIIAAIITGLPIARTALSALRYKVIGIDLLVTVAVIGATLIGEYWEAAIVAVLFTLGHYLEVRSINKTRQAIKSLLDQAPEFAWVERNGEIVELAPSEVKSTDVVVIRPGQKIPVDGKVTGGKAAVNQATITGESMPVDKTSGDYVYAGSIISSGYLRVSAEKVGQNTMFARILEMIEEAQDKKAKTQVFLERFASYYTPAIMVLAAITYLVIRDTYLALTLLVVACPGALVIATPISIVTGIGNGARGGLLIKGGESIENISAAKVVAFDKTGTLTEGEPRVVSVKTFGGINENDLLTLATSAEFYSEHPLGASIVEHATKQTGAKPAAPLETEVLTGLGIKAKTNFGTVSVGNRQLMLESNIRLNKSIDSHLCKQEAAGQTVMLVAKGKEIIGAISVADPIRTGAKGMVSQLRSSGKKVVMLTGDNKRTAQAIASQLGIDEVFSELLPTDKVAIVKQLQQAHGKVIMVGDGINDGPALAAADAGIAAEGVGKDIAMEVADIVLLSGDVSKLSYAIDLSRAIVRNMKINIYFAVGLVTILLIGVLTKNVIMSLGMLIHVVSVLLVILNASRLLGYNSKYA